MKKIIYAAILAVLPAAVHASGEAFTALTEAVAPAVLTGPAAPEARSVTELETPEYCRLNDRDLNALTEEVMTRESPRDPVTKNLFIELVAATPEGKSLMAKVVNVRHAHPGDQFHIEVYADKKLVFKSGRQDNPIFIGFQLDGVPYSLTCFEDIRARVPAVSRLGAAAQVKSSGLKARNTLLLLDTKTGKTFVVIAAGGGYIYNGKFYAAVYNGAGYILPSGQYYPVVGGSRAEDKWAAIVERALASGLIREEDEYIPGSRYFADLSGAADAPHKANYFSVWGYTDAETGAFLPDFVTMVSEDWAITPDGNWRIDQWLHWVALDGAPQRAQHTVLLEDMYGRILGMETENPAPTDPAAAANRAALITKWFLYQPVGK